MPSSRCLQAELPLLSKVVLGARSPVFLAMLGSGFRESSLSAASGEALRLPDLSGAALRRLLEYMYTGALGATDYKVTIELFRAADVYAFPALKVWRAFRCNFVSSPTLLHSSFCRPRASFVC